MIQLKVNPVRLKPGVKLEVTSIVQENPKLKVVEAAVLPAVKASILVYVGPKEIDWSRIADQISEVYPSEIGEPQGTNWELITES